MPDEHRSPVSQSPLHRAAQGHGGPQTQPLRPTPASPCGGSSSGLNPDLGLMSAVSNGSRCSEISPPPASPRPPPPPTPAESYAEAFLQLNPSYHKRLLLGKLAHIELGKAPITEDQWEALQADNAALQRRIKDVITGGGGRNVKPVQEAVQREMRRVTYWWAATQLFGPIAMPLWLAVFGTDWYTRVNLLPGEVALSVTVSKCFDVWSDPAMACYLRTCTMHSIANISWVGALVQGLAFAAFFYPFHPMDPGGGHARVFLQYFVASTVFFMGDTLQGTPTNTLGTMLKSQNILDTEYHNLGLQLGPGANVLGIIILGFFWFILSSSLVSLEIEWGREEGVQKGLYPWSNFWIGAFFGVWHLFFNFGFSVVVRGYANSKLAAEDAKPRSRTDWIREYSRMLTESWNNPFFRQLLFAWVCDALTLALLMKFLLWFVRHQVEPEMGEGCEPYDDPINFIYRPEKGFGTGVKKGSFECGTIEVTGAATLFAIFSMMGANVLWSYKIKRDKDEHGHSNVWGNWLLFNLTGAITNALLVFVDRGDNRIFWGLIIINAIPMGGMFMTDTILLYLITSEVWLRRDDVGMPDAQRVEEGGLKDWKSERFSQVFDVHTTKFGMMKTFIPKAVSLVAEAAPLALMQIWYYNPRDMCVEPPCCAHFQDPKLSPLLAFAGAPAEDGCKPYSPCGPLERVTDIETLACADYLRYNISDAPKYIPQPQKVRQLVQFFFYMLPFLLSLLSWMLKKNFQVTDSADYWMRSKVMRGVPGRRAREHAAEEAPPEDDASAVQRAISQWERARARAAAQGRPPPTGRDLARRLDDIHHAEEAARQSRGVLHRMQQALATLFKPTVLVDPWVGRMVPTSSGRHLFRLPHYTDNALGQLPADVLRLVCAPPARASPVSFPKHDIDDVPNAGRSLLLGFLAVLLRLGAFVVWLLWILGWVLVRIGLCVLRPCGLNPDADARKELLDKWDKEKLTITYPMVFGVAGGNTLDIFADKVLWQMALRMVSRPGHRLGGAAQHAISAGGADASPPAWGAGDESGHAAALRGVEEGLKRERVEQLLRLPYAKACESQGDRFRRRIEARFGERAPQIWAEGEGSSAYRELRALVGELQTQGLAEGVEAENAVQSQRARELTGSCVKADIRVCERLFRRPVCCPDLSVPEPRGQGGAEEPHRGPTHYRVHSLLHHCMWASVGVGLFFVLVLSLAVNLGGGVIEVSQGPYSVFVTVPLFLAAVAIVGVVYFWGLLVGRSKGDALAPECWDRDRQFSVDDLFALCVAHFNYFTQAGANPLIFDRDPPPGDESLLFALNAAVIPTDTAGQLEYSRASKKQFFALCAKNPKLWERYTSYVLFVPSGSMDKAMEVLHGRHRMMDEALSVASAQQGTTPVGWDVHNIAPVRRWEQHAGVRFHPRSGAVARPVQGHPAWPKGEGKKGLEEHYGKQDAARDLMRYCEAHDLVGFTADGGTLTFWKADPEDSSARLQQADASARWEPRPEAVTYFRSWQAYPFRCLLYSWWGVPEQTRTGAEENTVNTDGDV
eukprot:TRINITY_DN9464_c0_g1_i3.p1 TRINITY_DN9464_c0_g1~~TRINITY_DN9464_c0_g1_i3.p1  ORF type:complete len:1532 (+),score=437.73 TRINITY_DN9464_c0_g1_i3:59-4654(+)